jgi:hypothetical protein
MKSYSMRKLTKGVSTVNKANQQRAITKLIEGCVNQGSQQRAV